MIINIVNKNKVEVFGKTPNHAIKNTHALINFVGESRWRYLSGVQIGGEAGSELAYKHTLEFDIPTEEVQK